MSLTSEYWKAKKKREEEEKTTAKAKKSSSGSKSSSVKSSDSLTSGYWEARRNSDQGDIAPVTSRITSRMTLGDISPILRTTSSKKKKDKWYDGWFQNGAFEDGYDFGDITKTILGTTADVAEDIGTGIIGMGEKVVDAFATIAPYVENAQFLQNGGYYNVELQKQHDKAVEESKKDLSKFVAKDLYDEQKIAKKIVSGVTAGYDYEGTSALGEKSDSIVQSGGQLLGTLGLTALGVPWWLTTGATAFGGEAENAFNQGATYEEAALSATIAAGAEVLTEKLSGGIKFGGKALDDALTDQIARGVSDKYLRTALKMGFDMAGEGAEEWITEDINKFGQWLTYSDEEELKELLFSEEAMQEKIEAFIGGAALGGVSNVSNSIKSARQGVDAVSGRTNNEEAVVRKVYEDLVAEAEKKGKVSAKEKTEIYDKVVEDLEKGRISTDTIEELLDEEGYKAFQAEKDNFFNGDTMKSYDDTVASEEAQLKQLQEELDKLSDAPNTVGNNKLYDSIVSRMTELKENPGSNAIKAQLDQEVVRINEMKNQLRTKVHDMVKGTKLEESYNELIRSNEKYTADVSQYQNEHAKKTIQNILDSELADNTKEFHENADWLAKLSEGRGLTFTLTDNAKLKETGHFVEGAKVNGFINENGDITLNIDSDDGVKATAGHEVSHTVEGTKHYDAYKDHLFKFAIEKEGLENFNKRLDAYKELYKDRKNTTPEKELTAQLMGEYGFTDQEFVDRLLVKDRNLFQIIFDEIKYMYRLATAGSKAARELQQAMHIFEKSWKERGTKNTADGGVKYSLKIKHTDGKVEELADARSLTNEQAVEYLYQAKSGALRRDTYIPVRKDTPQVLIDTLEQVNDHIENLSMVMNVDKAQGAMAVANPGKKTKKYGDNIRKHGLSPEEIVEIINNLDDPTTVVYQTNRKDKNGNPLPNSVAVFVEYKMGEHEGMAAVEFENPRNTDAIGTEFGETNYHTVVTVFEPDVERDGMPFDYVEELLSNPDNTELKIERRQSTESATGEKHPNTSNELPSINSKVAQKEGSVNTKYSLSDTDGREVSSAVAKRFGNSKAVDENGNLKVLYHGTASGEFSIFDKTKGSVEGDFGSGFYFTDNEADVSEHYEGGGPDFENKVGRRADEIWGEEDIEYEEAEKKAREELYKGSHKFEVYLNIENPAIVGETMLFDGESYLEQYNEEDYEDYDDYIADVEQLVADNIDNIIWEVEKNVDINSTDGLADILYEAYYEGGIGIEELKAKINNLYVEDSNGNLVGNEVARQIIESLGYDGIIDPTVSGKWNMNIESGTTHYIVFKPNQIKAVTNQNPTDNPDIHRSLSKTGDTKRYINGDAPLNKFKYNPSQEFAPVIPTPDRSSVLPGEKHSIEEMFPDEPDISQAEYDNMVSVKEALENRMLEMSETGDFTDLEKINEEWVEAKTRLAELEAELSDTDRVDSLSDADAPPEMDAPYYESDPTTLTKKATADIVRDVRASLGLNNPQMADAKDIIERYRTGEIQSREQLVDALQDKFGSYTETEVVERLADLKREIRTRRLKVSDTIKHGIADYAHVMRKNRGKILFAKDGLDVDEFYKELQEDFPDFFNEDEQLSPENMFRQIVDIVNTPHIEEVKRNKDIENIEEVADLIINGIGDFKRNQNLDLSNKESKQAFESLVRQADKYAPMDDIAPVKKAPVKPTAKAPVKPVAKQQQTSGKVAQVMTKASKKPKQPGIGGKVVSALVDKGAVFEKVSLDTKNMEVQAKWQYALPTNTSARAQYFMENGEDGVKSLKSVMKEVDKSGKTEQFYNYLYHVHNIDRMTLEDRFGTPNKAVFGDSVTADISRKKSATLAKQNPEFKQWAEDIYSINKQVRNKMVEGGLISQEVASLWEQQYPHYVPTFRVDKNGANVNVPLDTNKTGVNNPVKRATGGSSDIEPLFNSMAQQIEQTYRAIARNSFGIELKNTLGTAIDSKPAAGVDEMIDTIEMQDELLKQRFGMNPTFTVFENGERVEFEITEDMYDALKPTNKILASRNPVIKWIGDNRRNLLTVWNPVFALYRNPIKDIQDVAINSQHAVRTYLNVPNAIYQMVADGKYAQEYHENGGKSNTYFDSRKNEFKAEDNLFKKAIGMPLRAIENAGEFIEEIPRLSEYIASRKEGRSVERSMLDAARVTTNFAAGGDFTKLLNSHGCTFLNASVQGAAQHVRNFREATKLDGLKGFTKTLAKYVVAGVPGIILNSLLWDDDEEYEELNDYVKQNYFVVAKTEDGKFVRIPKGRTTAVMQNLMEQMQHLVTGDDEADFATFFDLFMNNIAPNNPLDNNILAPIAQTLSNNAWYGGDIVPSRLQDLPAEEQFDESTDSISKWLGEKTGLSPIKLNYLLDQYSGGAGDVFLPMLTPEAESGDDSFMGNMLAPWKKEMTTDKVLNNKNPGDFYDLKDELAKMSNSRNATEEDKMKTMYMDAVSWEMGDLYAQKREIQSSDMPDSQKYTKVRELQEQINELAKNAMGGYENVSIDGLYSEVGGKRFNQDAESGRWYEIKAKNSDGSDNKYYQKEQEVTKALGISYGEYWNNREEYNYAYEKPEQYTVAKAVGGYQSYRAYTKDLYALKADKDKNGKSISGSKKEKVIDYVNNMDADYGTKIILFKSMYNADDTYNNDIIDYLNSRDDISYEEMETILKYLGFKVDSKGNITW